MHCSSCASNIERALRKLKGINNISVSILTNKAIIEADDNININEIKNIISKLGYNVIRVE